MQNYLIKNVQVVNEGRIITSDVLIKNGRIEKIGELITQADPSVKEINGEGKFLLPGAIDDQVHFREPGLTHKATIYTEARAAVAGGVTSFMEMPNTKPAALTQELLQEKYDIAAKTSLANYSFFMGASNDNLEEILRSLFSKSPMLIATHCEDEKTIRHNSEFYKEKYGENVPISLHPVIRN